MLGGILALIVILWLLGFVQIPFLGAVIFTILGHPITLENFLIFLLVAWVATLLPSPFREIAIILLILWVLSILGIIAIVGLSHLFLIAIIIGILVAIFVK